MNQKAVVICGSPTRRGGRELFDSSPRPILRASLSDDASLIEAALAGDSAAFGRLVGLYQDRLYNSLLRVLDSAEDARDLMQDAFVQAFVKLESFRGSSAFYTWLYRIAFNLAMSHARRAADVSLDGVKGTVAANRWTAGRPEADLCAARASGNGACGLAALSTEYRQILVLREIEGCSYEQIAEILELPIGTVRSRLFRARLQLRDCLAPACGKR